MPRCNTSTGSNSPSPLLDEKLTGEIDIVFTKNRMLDIRNEYTLRSQVPTAPTLVCLGFAHLVIETVARLTGDASGDRTAGYGPADQHESRSTAVAASREYAAQSP